MYRVSKRMEVAAMHFLKLDYDSPCNSVHGHNWIITVTVLGQQLNDNGMVYDFKRIKNLIHDQMDHKALNDIFSFNPTAENIAKWVADQVDGQLLAENRVNTWCSKVVVQESEGNIAEWSRD